MSDPSKTDDAIKADPDLPVAPAEDGITAQPHPAPAPFPESDLAGKLTLQGYRTAPDHTTKGWPPGIPYIVGNEACERFSFYGMNAILFAQLVSLYVLAGEVEKTANDLGTYTTHLFKAGVYTLPMIGAILADRLLGKYQTIFYVSLIYCAGHGVLACVDAVGEAQQKLTVMYTGLALIAIGSGGIKPCVSANVGDQFGKANWFRVRTIFQIFYFSVNFGSFFATLAIPLVLKYYGASVAFAIPGILMFLATLVFWMGRKKFVHVPPKPGGKIGLLDTVSSACLFLAVGHLFFTKSEPGWVIALASASFLAAGLALFFWRQRLAPDNGFLAIVFHAIGRCFAGEASGKSEGPTAADGTELPRWVRWRFWRPAVAHFGVDAVEGPVAVLKIISVFLLISVFWALFDQHSSSWIRQANMMDLTLWGDRKVEATQVPSLNPLMVMVLIPLMNLVYVACDKIGLRTPALGRITVGMFIAALSFVVAALIQTRIDAEGPGQVWFAWQVIAYVLITIAEVMVAVTALEFSYTQAPKSMKSTIMSFFNLTVALGNVLVALLARFGKLDLVDFFWVFAALMGAACVLFGIRGYFYVQRDYPQG
jgi:POT family proton-dependent oligopeptide transporter